MPLPLVSCKVQLLNHCADENQSDRSYRFAFNVPESCGRLTLGMDIDSRLSAQVPMILFDSRGEVRLMRAANATLGKAHTEYSISPAHADHGCIPGDLPAGEWKLLLYKRRMYEDLEALITVSYEKICDLPKDTQVLHPGIRDLQEKPFSAACLSDKPGWYCGELHTHSGESTGHTSLKAVVDAARDAGLDFLAITDHFTASHWLRQQEIADGRRPLLLQSMEVSGDFGHANIHGLKTWQNPLVDNNAELKDFLGLPERPTMAGIADKVHAEGGLFCINHALSGIMGWRYREFPMEKADLYEAYCTSELETAFLYATHWDMFLKQGLHLTGVGSSDSHHPTQKGPWELGKVLTWVYADSLSQADILKSLKRGRVFVGIGGAMMDMQAKSGGVTAHMGDTLDMQAGDEVTFTIDLITHPRGNLFIYADGMVLDTVYYDEAGEDQYTFTLPESWIAESGESYVRVEFHEMKERPRFFGMCFRDHSTTRLISNPIWLKRKEK